MSRKPEWLHAFIGDIIRREGGLRYENVANDRGGPTFAGITIGRLRTERGLSRTVDDLKALTEDDVRSIYESAYYVRPRIDWLPDPIQKAVMDFYVTSGMWAIKALQNVLNDVGFDIQVDGEIGADTAEATQMALDAMGDDLQRAYIVEKTNFFGRIVANSANQGKFLRGWINGRSRPFWKPEA